MSLFKQALLRGLLFGSIGATIAFVGALPGCSKNGSASVQNTSAPVTLAVMGPAPAWSLKDVDGKVISSEQFKGKVVVVDFWATWCAPCVKEIPGYIALQKKYGDKLAIVGISMDEAGVDVVKAFMAKNGVNYQIVMGNDQTLATFGGINSIPTTFLIDRNGQIRDRKNEALPHDEYEQRILAVLN